MSWGHTYCGPGKWKCWCQWRSVSSAAVRVFVQVLACVWCEHALGRQQRSNIDSKPDSVVCRVCLSRTRVCVRLCRPGEHARLLIPPLHAPARKRAGTAAFHFVFIFSFPHLVIRIPRSPTVASPFPISSTQSCESVGTIRTERRDWRGEGDSGGVSAWLRYAPWDKHRLVLAWRSTWRTLETASARTCVRQAAPPRPHAVE